MPTPMSQFALVAAEFGHTGSRAVEAFFTLELPDLLPEVQEAAFAVLIGDKTIAELRAAVHEVDRPIWRKEPLGEEIRQARFSSAKLAVGQYAHASYRLGLLERGRQVLHSRLRTTVLPHDPELIDPGSDQTKVRTEIEPVVKEIFGDNDKLSQDVFLARIRRAARSPILFPRVFRGVFRGIVAGEGAPEQVHDAIEQFGIGIDEYVQLLGIYLKELAIACGLLKQDSSGLTFVA